MPVSTLGPSSAPAEEATPSCAAAPPRGDGDGDGDDGAVCFEKRVALVGSSGGGAAAQGYVGTAGSADPRGRGQKLDQGCSTAVCTPVR